LSDLAAIKNWIYSSSSAGVKDERYLRQLRDVEQFFTYVFDNNPDGISVLDRDLTIMGVNQAMERWYENKSPLRGKKCYAAYHDRDCPCDFCPTRTALKTGESVVGVVPYETDAGAAGSQELLSFPLFDDRHAVIGVIEYVRDISRLEEEERVVENLKTRLQFQDKTLHDQETALRVLLRRHGLQEALPARNIGSSLSHLVTPLLARLEDRLDDRESRDLLARIRRAIEEVASPFARTLTSGELGFTPRELEVASLIVAGKSSKEIATSLGISTKAVSFHRTNMRRKLRLNHPGQNLRNRLIELSLT
jgi:DNA-binding CsgD family transcriptional regulator